MPSKKEVARWPVVICDYSKVAGENPVLTPVQHEMFVDYENIDLLYWEEGKGTYISFMDAIKGLLVWKNPEANYTEIINKYGPKTDSNGKVTSPAAMTVVGAIDTGIIYCYIGHGTWIPISINAIDLAKPDNADPGTDNKADYGKNGGEDGFMSAYYATMLEYATKTKDLDRSYPPKNPRKNYYYDRVIGDFTIDAGSISYDQSTGRLTFLPDINY